MSALSFEESGQDNKSFEDVADPSARALLLPLVDNPTIRGTGNLEVSRLCMEVPEALLWAEAAVDALLMVECWRCPDTIACDSCL